MLALLAVSSGGAVLDEGISLGVSVSITLSIVLSMVASSSDGSSEKVRENRLRRMAERQRLVLRKARRYDRHAWDYGTYGLYTLESALVADKAQSGFGLTLDEVEAYLKGEVDS